VRPAAQVEPAAGPVHGDRLVLGQLHHPFGLERLALLLEEGADVVAGPDLADQRLVGRDDPPHLLLDGGQILFGEGAAFGGRREIVIEAVLGRRAEGDLGARIKALNRLGEDMGEIVPRQLERVRLVAHRDQGELAIFLERAADIAQLAIDPRRQRRLGEAGPDRRRHVRRARPPLDLADRSVGQHNRKHFGHRAWGSSGRRTQAP